MFAPDSRPAPADAPNTAVPQDTGFTVLDLIVSNHPGVMSHVCGLFSRRAFNVEAILCMPVGDGLSRILLLVPSEERLTQMIAQAMKLRDVHEVRTDASLAGIFDRLRKVVGWNGVS
ncbi:MAG: ACT domain-containing protein [Desulfovibrionaceae bacterium]|jgi:acetolactate synthase-1/3 small subunit|nr:ACT domain-containing protein [Desulfovibrionaceae bacterium]